MDPLPPSTITAAATSTVTTDPHVPLLTSKLRLMCSYGGHIVPRPRDNSLCYAGGDTRLVSVDLRTTATSLSALTSQLSRTLYNNRPFHLKYQLPDEDLDSLISVTTDEDLHNMLEEHDRIVSSPTPSRIRLFLFPVKSESVGSVLLDPKAESWFSDALKNTCIIPRGQSADAGLSQGLVGLDCVGLSDSSVESLSNSGGETKQTLETSSSFGSTNSSISMTNLPSIGVHGEDGGVLQDLKVKVSSPSSFECDASVGSAVSYPKTGIYQEPLIHVASGVSSSSVESETICSDSSSMIPMQRTAQLSGYQLSHQSDHKQHQQEVQYIHAGAHYIQQYPTGPLPISSYYPTFQPQLHQQQQQQHNPYQANQFYPVYLIPVRPTQSYNMSMQSNLIDNSNYALSRPPLHPNTAPPVAYKEVTSAPPIPESATKVYRTVNAATPLVNVSSDQNQQQFVGHDNHHPSEPMATADYNSEFDDDVTYTPIYKTQPPSPALSS